MKEDGGYGRSAEGKMIARGLNKLVWAACFINRA